MPGAEDPQERAKSRIRHYADILNPLFWMDEFNFSDRMLEFVCTLVRAAGLESTGWDSHQESLAFLEDLKRLGHWIYPKINSRSPITRRLACI